MKKILIVGYGSIGKRHVNNLLKESNFEIIICTKQKNLKFKNKRVTAYNSLEQCLGKKPSIGFVTNETSLHVQTAIKLAKNNLDLFLEKPLSNSKKNIVKLEKIVKEKKLIVQMGYHFRFHKCIKKIYQLILQKKIGRIISVQIENNSYLPDWHPNEDYTKSYAAIEKLGGGIVLTQIHELDYLYWFFGKPKSIFSVTGKFSDLKLSVDDFSSSIIEFEHKIIAEVHLDFFQGPEFRSCKIKGTKG
ncbi:MAG: Gfo/Idh/MocA family oxidoreductase, partial [Lutibacter sp.]|nr:Gfo/Idh/MocA family oxidoreductase [Lutibacter sp.]